MDEIKPCPFCNKPPITTPSGEGGKGLMIECLTEGCVNPHVSYYNHDVARTAWNTRPREDAGVVDEWRQIETCPYNQRVLLWCPESGAWAETAWVGERSGGDSRMLGYDERFKLATPYSQQGRQVWCPLESKMEWPKFWRTLPQPPALAAALGKSNG
ncbi:Lar family restriction alleviation protein [Pseudomonas sp. R2.Fl]|nr:Lar family restriction alleviation protein [Pseudomonas sp. R2.Fl]MCL6714367.1 Lar family restriction alleviation protein [Pseudomonas sp. R2.Fl]